MKLWVTGSQDWDDPMVIARIITILIQDMDENDKDIVFMHLDREGAEQLAGSYVAKTKTFLSGKGFKVSEFIPAKSNDFDDRIRKVLDQSPNMRIVFNKGKDFKTAKIREMAEKNNILVLERKNP